MDKSNALTFIKKKQDIIPPLSEKDQNHIDTLNTLYEQVLQESSHFNKSHTEKIVDCYKQIGDYLQEVLQDESQIKVYSFIQPPSTHGEISRIIAKLRDVRTSNIEFTYYIQRAFEKLFSFGFSEDIRKKRNYISVQTPVDIPSVNYAIHKLPDLDQRLHNTVMCVMLRGALLPSIIMSKEIQEYSSIGYITDFALFRISRNDTKDEEHMEYMINEKTSYFQYEQLHDKDVIIADPMNATGGSILTVLAYLKEVGIVPRSIKLFHAISSLQGSIQIVRQYENVEIFTLWVDPILNYKAYIMPGLGDAGDRINGEDNEESPRNILQLIAHYGQNILQLYRAQIHKIEESLLGYFHTP